MGSAMGTPSGPYMYCCWPCCSPSLCSRTDRMGANLGIRGTPATQSSVCCVDPRHRLGVIPSQRHHGTNTMCHELSTPAHSERTRIPPRQPLLRPLPCGELLLRSVLLPLGGPPQCLEVELEVLDEGVVRVGRGARLRAGSGMQERP